MSTFSLQLLKPSDYKKRKTVPGGAIVYIALKCWTVEEEFPVLSSRCFSSSDVVRDADIIIKELEIIKKQAKQFFQKEKEKLEG